MTADARGQADTWGTIARTYIRPTGDRSLPVAMQDRLIAEADALTPDNPYDVHTLDTSHVGFLLRPRRWRQARSSKPRNHRQSRVSAPGLRLRSLGGDLVDDGVVGVQPSPVRSQHLQCAEAMSLSAVDQL